MKLLHLLQVQEHLANYIKYRQAGQSHSLFARDEELPETVCEELRRLYALTILDQSYTDIVRGLQERINQAKVQEAIDSNNHSILISGLANVNDKIEKLEKTLSILRDLRRKIKKTLARRSKKDKNRV